MPAFSPGLFAFLTELAANNDRPWFTTNKARFERDVKAPLHAFVAALAPKLAAVDPDALCSDRSVFRIYRDTRFGADKRPYKTHVALQFPRGALKGPSATGYYLHLEPGRSFVAGGLWAPEPAVAAQIRAAIDAQRARWTTLRDDLGGLDAGESLVRVPRGFPADDPLADDLRRKSFTASVALTDADVVAADLEDRVARACGRLRPLVTFLGEVSG